MERRKTPFVPWIELVKFIKEFNCAKMNVKCRDLHILLSRNTFAWCIHADYIFLYRYIRHSDVCAQFNSIRNLSTTWWRMLIGQLLLFVFFLYLQSISMVKSSLIFIDFNHLQGCSIPHFSPTNKRNKYIDNHDECACEMSKCELIIKFYYIMWFREISLY